MIICRSRIEANCQSTRTYFRSKSSSRPVVRRMKNFRKLMASSAILRLLSSSFGTGIISTPRNTGTIQSIPIPTDNLPHSNLTLAFATPIAVSEAEDCCEYGYVPCGPVCCHSGHQATDQRKSSMSKVFANFRGIVARMSRYPTPALAGQHYIDQLQHISHHEFQCPKSRSIVSAAASHCVHDGVDKSELVEPAFRPPLGKGFGKHAYKNPVSVHGIVPRQAANDYVLVCLGAKEAIHACQEKEFGYYCDESGVVKNNGKYNDEECDEYCESTSYKPYLLDPSQNPSLSWLYQYSFTNVSRRLH